MSRPFFSQSLTGTPIVGYEDGLLYNAEFSRPYGITYYENAILITDRSEPTSIRKITRTTVSSLKWSNTTLELLHPTDILVLNDIVFICDRGHDKIRYISNQQNELKTLEIDGLKNPCQMCTYEDNLLVLDETSLVECNLIFSDFDVKVEEEFKLSMDLTYPEGLLVHRGDIYVSNTGKHEILKKSSKSDFFELFAGSTPGFEDGSLENAKFRSPAELTACQSSIFVSDRDNETIRMIADGQVTSLSQGLSRGYQNGPCDVMKFNEPAGILSFKEQDITVIVVCDCKNACIRIISNGRFCGDDISGNLDIIFSDFEEDAVQNNEEVQEQEEEQQGNQMDEIDFSKSPKQLRKDIVELEESLHRTQKESFVNQDILFNMQESQNVERPLDYAPVEQSKIDIVRSKQFLCISPYDAFIQIAKDYSFDMVKLHNLFVNIKSSNTQNITDFINSSNSNCIYPLCFGYYKYFNVIVQAMNKQADFDENMKTLLILRNLLIYGLLSYKIPLFKQIKTPTEHSQLLAELSQNEICVKIRVSLNGKFLQVTKNKEFHLQSTEQDLNLFTFEMEVVQNCDIINNYSEFECEVECIPLEISSKQLFFELKREGSYEQGTGKIDLRIDQTNAMLQNKTGFLIKLKIDEYEKEIFIKFSEEQSIKTNNELSRVMQLQQMYCFAYIE